MRIRILISVSMSIFACVVQRFIFKTVQIFEMSYVQAYNSVRPDAKMVWKVCSLVVCQGLLAFGKWLGKLKFYIQKMVARTTKYSNPK